MEGMKSGRLERAVWHRKVKMPGVRSGFEKTRFAWFSFK